MITDRRESGVYISVEDASVTATTTEIGREVFSVGVCEKGPHNRIVSLDSFSRWQLLFGKPNYKTTTQSHYIFDNAIKTGATGYYIRVMPLDSKVANVSLMLNVVDQEILGTFLFTRVPKDVVERPYPEDYELGEIDTNYILDLDAYNAYITAYKKSREVVIMEEDAYNSISEGDMIYAGPRIDPPLSAGENEILDDSTIARQIVSKEWNDTLGQGVLILDEGYSGYPFIINDESVIWTSKTTTSILIHKRVSTYSDPLSYHCNVTADRLDLTSTESAFSFWAVGSGTYYNKLSIKGVRNSEYEKMYMDDDGTVLFKYLFMDIAVYETKDDGSISRVEGPWTIAFGNTTSDNIKIVDQTSGENLYIVDVINKNSEYIYCKEGPNAINMIRPGGDIDEANAELNRLHATLLLSANNPIGTEYIPTSSNNLKFDNGFNGHADYVAGGDTPTVPLYKYGALQMAPALEGLIQQAYSGTLESVDGSIDELLEDLYPIHKFDYVLTGGFSPYIQEAGRELADFRQTCIHLADTGFRSSASADIKARNNYYDWNNWTSMLYGQFRQIRDPYTGEDIKISPVYHAIERHLVVDGQYFIGEAVAGIEKGAIPDSIDLQYKPNHKLRGDLLDKKINCTIKEPDGTYFNSEVTTWKRLSVLDNGYVAKFVAYIKKRLPNELKDILHRKATGYWISQGKSRINTMLSKFRDSSIERYQILEDFSVNVEFDNLRSELNCYVTLVPIRTIQRINVFIIVK